MSGKEASSSDPGHLYLGDTTTTLFFAPTHPPTATHQVLLLQAPPPRQTTLRREIGYFQSLLPLPGPVCLFFSGLISANPLFRAFTTSPTVEHFGSNGDLLIQRGLHSSEGFLVNGAPEEEEEEVYENHPIIMATNGRPPSRPPPPLSRPPGVRPVQFGPSPTGPPPSMAPPPVPQSPAGSRKLSLQPQYTRAPEPVEPVRQFKFGETKLRSPSPSRNTVSRNGTVERKVSRQKF